MDDLAEIISRDPLNLTVQGPEIQAIIAFYRSKRKDFLFPKEKEKKKAVAEPPKKLSLEELMKGV
jgi:hypothetical protein